MLISWSPLPLKFVVIDYEICEHDNSFHLPLSTYGTDAAKIKVETLQSFRAHDLGLKIQDYSKGMNIKNI